jgi:hypothetical protein
MRCSTDFLFFFSFGLFAGGLIIMMTIGASKNCPSSINEDVQKEVFMTCVTEIKETYNESKSINACTNAAREIATERPTSCN